MNKIKVQFILMIMCCQCMQAAPFISSAQQAYDEYGTCSYYGDGFNGRYTSAGELFDNKLYTCAHRTLPFNTMLKVTNLANNKSVVVRVNDRGPIVSYRLIDISKAAAAELGMVSTGVINARLEYVGMADADSVKRVLAEMRQQRIAARAGAIDEDAVAEVPSIASRPEPRAKSVVNNNPLIAKNFYNQELRNVNPGGFGLQVGYFNNLSNCRNAMHYFEAKYSVKAFMYTERKRNDTFYRLILGQFKTVTSAAQFKRMVVNEVKDCFIITYAQL